jgi:F-type H+-transporting ATPase subunit a
MLKGCGCSTRVAVLVGIVLLAVVVFGFMVGAVGQALGLINSPALVSTLGVQPPHVVLPSETVFTIGGYAVKNTLLASLLTTVVLLALFIPVTRKMKLIPGRMQSMVEMLVETLLNFIEGISGKAHSRKFLPVIATIFLFVMFNAYLALVPLFGTWGGKIDLHGVTVIEPFFRSANTDVNFTMALAICAFIFIEYWGFKSAGFVHYMSEFIKVGQFHHGMMGLFKGKGKAALADIFFGIINIFIGLIELLSHFIRIVSFTFRLFGNMTAGEILLIIMSFLIPFLAAIPFYGLELLVGVVQALIFAGLTLVFATIAVESGHEQHGESHE